MNDDAILGIFAKQPLPGQAKTRLGAGDWPLRVADAFLRDSPDRLASIDVRRVLVYAPPEADGFFTHLSQQRYDLWRQTPGDLGARLQSFFQRAFAEGARRAAAVGSDSPTLPTALVEQAFEALRRADVVLGPTCDGGYYVVGSGPVLPPIFDAISWSSPDVLRQTVARLDDPALRLALLPPWYDIDTPADWSMLCGHVLALRRAGIDPGAPRTQLLVEEYESRKHERRKHDSGN